MEHLRIEDLKAFSKEKRVRQKLVSSEKMIAELVCYEPGQMTVEHVHPKQDEIFYIVEGKGYFLIDGEQVPVAPTSVVFVPAQTKHGIRTMDDSGLVVMFIKSPGPNSAAEA